MSTLPDGTAMTCPSPSWSVFECRIVSLSPSRTSSRSASCRATSSERRSAAARPSAMTARSRIALGLDPSAAAIIRARSAARMALFLRVGRARCSRRMPASVSAMTSRGSRCCGATCPACLWCQAMAARCRPIVLSALPACASEARYVATASGIAGIGSRSRTQHHSSNCRQSLS